MRWLALRLLLVLALVAPALALTPEDAGAVTPAAATGVNPAVATAGAVGGQWIPVDPATAWGGTGTRLAAGETRVVTLRTGRAVPTDAQALVVQVQTSAAGTAGALALGPADAAGDDVVAFDAGSGSSTALVAVGDDRRASLRTDADVRVSLTVIGYVSAVSEAPAAGSVVAVRPAVVVDSATDLGGAVPGGGATSTVPLAGLAGLPDSGVSGVWLAVQTHGTGTGTVQFPLPGGPAADAAPVTTRWTSTLVLAPVSDRLDLTYSPVGSGIDGLRIAVVGWIADGTHGTADAGALTPTPAVATPVGPSLLGLQRLDLTRGAVPSAASSVVVSATVTTGALPGELRLSSSVLTLLLLPDTAAPLPARTATTVTTVVALAQNGDAYVAVPAGARLTSVTVLGFHAGEVRADADREAPAVAITSPAAGAHVSQVDEPVVTLAGSASDLGSGVRSVTVRADGTDLGAAALRTTASGETLWAMDTTPAPGAHTVEVTATDWAGRTAAVTASFTVDGAAEDDAVVNPAVTVLDASSLISEVAADRVVLGGTTDLRAGDVVVADVTDSTPEGLLRRVRAVERVAGQTVLHTGPGSLTDLFLQVDLRAVDVPLTGGIVQVDGSTGEVVAARAARGSLEHTFTLSGSASSGPVSAKVSSEVTISLSLTIDIDIEWGWDGAEPQLNEFEMLFGADTSSAITGTFTVAGSPKVDVPLGDITLGRVFFMVGVVPVWLTPELDPSFFLKGTLSQSSTVEFGLDTSLSAGIVYEDGRWTPVSDSDTDGHLDGNVKVCGSISGGLRMPLAVKLYDVAGPYASVDLGPELSLTADAREQKTTGKLDFVLGVSVGAKVEALSKTLVDVSYDLDVARTTVWSRTWPWTAQGFGLVDVGLDVCLPTYADSTHSHSATEVGTGSAGDQVFRLDAGATALLTDDTQYIEQVAVLLQLPGSAPGDDVSITWSYDPDGWYGQYWPEIYTLPAQNVAADEGPGMWQVMLPSAPIDSARDGFDEFTVHAAGTVRSAWTDIVVREYMNEDQGLCAYRPGTTIADGLPAEDGLHWDAWQYGAVQFSLEDDLTPTGTTTVRLVCTDDGSGYWPHDTDAEMGRASSYERWTERFDTTERETSVWLFDAYASGAGVLDCRAEASDDTGRVLATFPLVGGALDAPWRDVVPT